MRGKALLGLALLVASLALLAAGCTGGDEPAAGEVAAEEWADGFCTAVTAWTEELQRLGEDLGDPSSLSSDSIEQAAEDVNAATDDFVEDIRDLGTPDTESGQEIEDSVEALADSVEAERAKISEAVEDSEGISEVAQAVAVMGTSLSAMATAFQTTFEALEDADVGGELQDALEQSDACDEIS